VNKNKKKQFKRSKLLSFKFSDDDNDDSSSDNRDQEENRKLLFLKLRWKKIDLNKMLKNQDK